MRYDLSATEILKRLGYQQLVGTERLKQWMEEKEIIFPKVYCEFMEVAMDCPMLETADLWVGQMGNIMKAPWFFYEEIEEQLEDWGEDVESSEYGPFSKLPKERWGEIVSDFLQIGSDYGAGIVRFAIRREDLGQEDPPVFMSHEANAITDWRQMYERLSDYLLEVVLNVLKYEDYDTAAEVLEERGYQYLDYDNYVFASEEIEEQKEEELLEEEEWQTQVFQESGIDLNQVYKRRSNNIESELFCCYEEEKEILYVGELTKDEVSLVMIYREEKR